MALRHSVGDEVIFTKGELVDVRGVVVEPWYQISQSDWPEVIVEFGKGRREFVDIDDVRPAEDPYEYNIQKDKSKPFYNTWESREVVEILLHKVQSGIFADPDYRLVRRRKAGPVEYV